MNKKYKTGSSNIIMADYPDPDIIRIDDTYYMISTTMHMLPGAVILRSYNLLDWEFCSYVFDELDQTPSQKLEDNRGIYGKGMWAASLRHHNGLFYVSFVCNDTHKTYLYTSEKIEGPWKKQIIPGFFHDMSVLFDDDGKAYVVSGNMNITLTEFYPDLSKPKENGLNKVIIQDNPENVWLGHEGSHFYKINGKYYIFTIHMPKGKMRTEACFVSDKIEGPYVGQDILCSDLGNWNSGCAQGGIIQSNDDKWYSIVFQDHGALGRIPILIPVTFDEKGFPIFGERSVTAQQSTPTNITVLDNRPNYKYSPLYSTDFTNPAWQWNHSHNPKLVEVTNHSLKITTDKTVVNVTQAANTYTHRTFGHHFISTVQIDASTIRPGDHAGLCALEGVWAMIAVTRENNQFYLESAERKEKNPQMNTYDPEPPMFLEKIPLDSPKLTLRLDFSLTKDNQSVKLMYSTNGNQSFTKLGNPSQLKYTLDQFMGVRTALFCYSTENGGGSATFSNINFEIE